MEVCFSFVSVLGLFWGEGKEYGGRTEEEGRGEGEGEREWGEKD